MKEKERIAFVKEHYKQVANKYHKSKTDKQAMTPIFDSWLNHPVNSGKILELGCGGGFPVAKKILEAKKQYLGVDLSEEMIEIAKQELSQWSNNFKVGEMLEFCKNSDDNLFSGITTLLSIRHLPRINHVELFYNIYRILIPGGLYLLTVGEDTTDEIGSWYDGNAMYWSGFSAEWTTLTLKELGFITIDQYGDYYDFDGKPYKTTYLLLQKPIR